jgi:CDP-paratose 2-epimerase
MSSGRLPERVLVTGGAGFVGANLSLSLAARGCEVLALDNLRRRGAELNVARLRDAGVQFVHGDVRVAADVDCAGPVDAIVECSAEPSALAGSSGPGPAYVVDSNLTGAFHCFELARRHSAQVVFLSTSRVYPVEPLNRLRLRELDTRFELEDDQPIVGASAGGISEQFPLGGARTLYGATKLAAELLLTEYQATFEVPAVVNRCGVIAGPWQMGKVDQGVFTHWLLSHYTGRPLAYLGYDGAGKQVRDLLHVDDLVALVTEQLSAPSTWAGAVVNVGGGPAGSLSLLETTALCRELTGREVPITGVAEKRLGDVPVYVSDCRQLFALTDWRPRHTPRQVLEDTLGWIVQNDQAIIGAMGDPRV